MFRLLPRLVARLHTPQRASNRGAFTLIELLVVIAIISLLAAILFPVFARARENARKTSCLSNVRQLAVGFTQYFQDYDEQFPLLGKNGAPDTSWIYTMQPYIKSTQLLRCPSDTSRQWLDHGDWYDPVHHLYGRWRNKSQAHFLHAQRLFARWKFQPGHGGNFPNLADIQKQGNLIFLAESTFDFYRPLFPCSCMESTHFNEPLGCSE